MGAAHHSDQDALQDIATMREGLTGVLRLAIIPAATPVAPIIYRFVPQTLSGRVAAIAVAHTSVETSAASRPENSMPASPIWTMSR